MKVLFIKKPFIILLLFLLSLSNINSQEQINLSQNKEFYINDVAHYNLGLSDSYQNSYIIIEMEGRSNMRNYIVSVYSDSSRMVKQKYI